MGTWERSGGETDYAGRVDRVRRSESGIIVGRRVGWHTGGAGVGCLNRRGHRLVLFAVTPAIEERRQYWLVKDEEGGWRKEEEGGGCFDKEDKRCVDKGRKEGDRGD